MKISETFGPALQGEGISAGVPSVFLRFAGCNLDCGSKGGTWKCDSKAIWNQSTDWSVEKWINYLEESLQLHNVLSGKTHIVLTGGEPLLHKDSIKELYDFLRIVYSNYTPYFEIETNGTIYSDGFLRAYIDQVNCSPKLSNSGEPIDKRINPDPDALQEIARHPNSWFKFVVSSESDWKEIQEDFLGIVPIHKVILMPAGASKAELDITGPIVWKICCENGIRYSDRLQVRVWDKKVGV